MAVKNSEVQTTLWWNIDTNGVALWERGAATATVEDRRDYFELQFFITGMTEPLKKAIKAKDLDDALGQASITIIDICMRHTTMSL